MPKLTLWNNLTIRHKIWGLIIVPVLVISLLAGHQLLSLHQQVKQLEHAAMMAKQLESLSSLNFFSHQLGDASDNIKVGQLVAQTNQFKPAI